MFIGGFLDQWWDCGSLLFRSEFYFWTWTLSLLEVTILCRSAKKGVCNEMYMLEKYYGMNK